MRRIPLILLFALFVASCGGRGAAPVQETPFRGFPQAEVPGIYTSAEDKLDYLAAHYWDGYFSGTGPTDSTAVLGVRTEELEQALANYIYLLDNLPFGKAQKSLEGLFLGVEAVQKADSSSLFFLRFSETVARYLYDPNSPLRNEDYFLPYVRGLAASPCTREDMRTGYAYQARMCALNQFGQKAPDIRFRTARGKNLTLYGVKAGYTLLFFSNPGCEACKSIMDNLLSRPYLGSLISSGALAVVCLYIDAEIDKWLAYEPQYPRNWITGYDYGYTIRESEEYDVRAIPSLYLLDSEKRVLMKDAPTEKVLAFLDNLDHQLNDRIIQWQQ